MFWLRIHINSTFFERFNGSRIKKNHIPNHRYFLLCFIAYEILPFCSLIVSNIISKSCFGLPGIKGLTPRICFAISIPITEFVKWLLTPSVEWTNVEERKYNILSNFFCRSSNRFIFSFKYNLIYAIVSIMNLTKENKRWTNRLNK